MFHFNTLKKAYTIIQCSALLLAVTCMNCETYQNCSEDTGGGICPEGNTCCLMTNGNSGCIASDMGAYNGTCCKDGRTGCAVGYTCELQQGHGYCFASDYAPMSDPLVHKMPRYRLCNARGIDRIYGFIVGDKGASLAYYSSHGPVEQVVDSPEMALIVVHGAQRNGDDYFCSANAAVEMQKLFSNVLVIALQFYSEADERVDPSFLYWEESKDGPWRYGENSVGPTHISSFGAMDELTQYLWKSFPSMDRMVITGHSSGGQFAQRWALLTPAWAYEYNHKMRVVVANPSSYAYLFPLRYIQDQWRIPDDGSDCHLYNQWEWGLESDMKMLKKNPYVYAKLQNKTMLLERYRKRQLFYLVGGQDKCNISSHGWCNSHGLETTCMDNLQGATRLERNENYIVSLFKLEMRQNHVRIVVQGIGHDHSLIFQSIEGQNAIFERAAASKSNVLVPIKDTPVRQKRA